MVHISGYVPATRRDERDLHELPVISRCSHMNRISGSQATQTLSCSGVLLSKNGRISTVGLPIHVQACVDVMYNSRAYISAMGFPFRCPSAQGAGAATNDDHLCTTGSNDSFGTE